MRSTAIFLSKKKLFIPWLRKYAFHLMFSLKDQKSRKFFLQKDAEKRNPCKILGRSLQENHCWLGTHYMQSYPRFLQ